MSHTRTGLRTLLSSIAAIAMSVLPSMPLVPSALTAQAQRLPAGNACPVVVNKPYRSPESTTVFVVTARCTKRPVFNPEVFLSHFDWKDVIFIEQAEMDSIPNDRLSFMPWGARRTFESGSLVKTTDDDRVYLISNDQALPIEDESSFKSLGYSFDQVEDVASEVLSHFKKQKDTIRGPQNVPTSFVFKYPDNPDVYILKEVDGGLVKERITSLEALKRLYRADRIGTLPKEETFPDPSTPEDPITPPVIEDPSATQTETPADPTLSNAEPTPVPTVEGVSITAPQLLAAADTSRPSISFTSPEANALLTGTVTLRASASDNVRVTSVEFRIGSTVISTDTSSPYTASLNSNSFANGTYTLRAIARDAAGNSRTATRTVRINRADTTAPTVSWTAPASGGIAGVVTLQVSASDNVGVSSVQFRIASITISTDTSAPFTASLDTTTIVNGTYLLSAVARDAAGNAATTSRNVVISNTVADTTAPAVSFTTPAANATVSGSISITASASDNVGVSSVEFRAGSTVLATDTSSPYSATFNTTSVANGSVTLTAIARDAAGNQTTITRSVTISNVVTDTTLPVVSFTAPAANAAVSGSVIVSADASDNVGVASVEFRAGSTVLATDTSAPYSTSFNTASVANGSVTLTAIARDAAGNTVTATRSITIQNTVTPPADTVAPTVSLTAPAANATVSGSVAVSADSADNVGVASVEFRVGSTVIGTDTSSPYSVTLNTTSLTNGSVMLSAIARDAVGNSATASRTVTVSNTTTPPPTGSHPNDRSAIGTNMSPVNYYASEWMFLDLLKGMEEWGFNDRADQTPLDADGWPTSLPQGPVGNQFMSLGKRSPSGTFVMTWQGQGTIALDFNNITVLSDTANRRVFRVANTGNDQGSTLRIMITATNVNDHLRNIRIVPQEYEALANAGEVFHPLYLERLAKYRVLRFTAPQEAQDSLDAATWAGRVKPNQVAQGRWQHGVAIEHLIDVANKVHADPWFIIPAKATDDYVQGFAALVRDRLDPTLKAYIEYSNEVWNADLGTGTSFRYAAERGHTLGIDGPDGSDFSSALHYQGYRSVQVFAIFDQALGSAARSRMVRVIAGQVGYTDRNQFILDFTLPDGSKVYQHADAFATAPYFCGSVGSPENWAQVSQWNADQLIDYCAGTRTGSFPRPDWDHTPGMLPTEGGTIPEVIATMRTDAQTASTRGLAYVGYEGGQHMVGTGSNQSNATANALFDAANRSPRMQELYNQLLNGFRSSGGHVFVLTQSVYPPDQWGRWGMLEYQDQPPASAPKFTAVSQWIDANPQWW